MIYFSPTVDSTDTTVSYVNAIMKSVNLLFAIVRASIQLERRTTPPNKNRTDATICRIKTIKSNEKHLPYFKETKYCQQNLLKPVDSLV